METALSLRLKKFHPSLALLRSSNERLFQGKNKFMPELFVTRVLNKNHVNVSLQLVKCKLRFVPKSDCKYARPQFGQLLKVSNLRMGSKKSA